jgi:hypothetical protein
MTACDRLPSIVKHGAILSGARREADGIPESEEPHYWGTDEKREAFFTFVICSFMPPWWMCKKHREELAIIVLDAEAVCCRDDVLFCPANSALSAYPVSEILTREGVDSFDDCFPNPDTYQASDSEIFVPDEVPLKDFRAIVFCDEQAREHWLPRMSEAWHRATPKPVAPPAKIKTEARGIPGFYFPGNWTPEVRLP